MAYGDWKIRLQEAKLFMDDISKNWADNVKLFNGKKKFKGDAEYDYYVPILNQTYKSLKAQIIPASVDFYANVVGSNDPQTSALISALLNTQLSTEDFMSLLDKLDTQTICKGYSWGQPTVEFIKMSEAHIEYEGEEIAMPSGIERIKPVFYRTEDVIFDPNADSFDSIRWIGAAYFLTLEEFLDDEGLPKGEKYAHKQEVMDQHNIERNADGTISYIDKPNVVPNPTAKRLKTKQRTHDNVVLDPRFYRIKIWEIWDTYERKKLHIEDRSYEIVYNEDYPIKNPNFRHPFVHLSYTDTDDEELPPHPEIENVLDLQKQYIRLRQNQLEDATKRFRAFVALPDAFDKPEIQKAIMGDKKHRIVFAKDSVFPRADAPRDVRTLITPLPENPSPPDTQAIATNIMYDLQQGTGIGPAERGGMPITGTATETNVVAAMLQGRAQKKLGKVLNFCKRFADISLMIIAEKFSPETVVQLYEMGRPAAWSPVRVEIIRKSRFAVEVFPGTKGITDRQQRLVEYLNMFRTLYPAAQHYNLNLLPLIQKMLYMVGLKPSEIESVFNQQQALVRELAMDIARIVEDGRIDQQEGMIFIGKTSALVQKMLTPADVAEIQGKFNQTGRPQGPQSAPGAGSQRLDNPETATQDIGRGME